MLLRREEGRCFSQETVVLPQFEDFLAQAFEFFAFGLVQRSGRLTVQAAAGSFFLHPGAQCLLAEVQFLGDRADGAPVSMTRPAASLRYSSVKDLRCFFILLINDILSNAGSADPACSAVH